MRLIEPDEGACFRMRDDRLADLSYAKAITAEPFRLYPCFKTVCIHFGSLLSLKEILPRAMQSVTEIAHVHYLLRNKLLADCGVYEIEHRATTGERCFTSKHCRLNAIEEDFARPVQRVR